MSVTRNNTVKIGATIPMGVAGVQTLIKLKLGNFGLTKMPNDFSEALKMATMCRQHGIYFIFGEFLHRGSRDLYMMERKQIRRAEFLSREQLDQVFAAGGKYYLGRMTLGEAGGLLYWPRQYVVGRACGNYTSFPPAKNVEEACRYYVDFMRETIAYERKLTGGRLLDVDSSMTFKYHLQAGIDIPVIESMPGNCDFLVAALRGAARAYDCGEWGVHVAMHCYGGSDVCDRMWLQRWRVAIQHAYLSGATFIYPESGHFTKCRHGFQSPEMKTVRASLRELWQFSNIHARPAGFPEVRIGFVHGQFDGHPGLWNKYVWGQYHAGKKWLQGPPEWGWDLVGKSFRKEDWWTPEVRGDRDFSGHPPGGLYDIVPAEAPARILKRYKCLVFLGWNTMTAGLYARLKEYVRAGGHLVMATPHLSIETDRGKRLRIFRDGDVADLFGVRIKGQYLPEVAGLKYVNDSSLRSYVFSRWCCDPKFIGNIARSKVQFAGARVLAGLRPGHKDTEEDMAARPMLVEHRLGKGVAFLVTTASWPGEKGMAEFMNDILRTVFAGEQAPLCINGSDRVQHAVYRRNGRLTTYLLNTDLDTEQTVELWIGGRKAGNTTVPAADMRVLFQAHGLALIPTGKFCDIRTWRCRDRNHTIDVVNLQRQSVCVVNLLAQPQKVTLNGRRVRLEPHAVRRITVTRRVDEKRRQFYEPNFMSEPPFRWTGGGLPY